ncbi:MAG: alpha-galactosidase [Oscillospiraceae bacterium]|nr:alpha-galactosidase [Oscillospiraceae bacterium]
MSSNDLHRKTPIMGWASWNRFFTNISEECIKAQMDALVDTGLAEYGYIYCNTDDGFFGGRGEDGRLMFHKERFPNGIKVLADYAHKLGLKAGIYSEAGDNTCGHYYNGEAENGKNVGLYGFEERDLNMYLDEFGFDFIKVDWCGGVRLGLDEYEQYGKIGRIVEDIRKRTGRQLVYNICRWQFPGAWAPDVADSWRTGADIAPRFDSVLHQIDNIKPLAKYCGPGHVNDLDMMQIGNGMSLVEDRTHFTMWCMMSTPLIIGCDLTSISADTLDILKNKELIAINQDSACLQAFAVKEFRDENDALIGEIWVKDLGERNSPKKAVVFLNRSETAIDMAAEYPELGLGGKILSVRDLIAHADIDSGENISLTVPPHDAAAFVITAQKAVCVSDINEVPDEVECEKAIKISLDEAKRLAAEGAYLVDVRTPAEYAESHLDGAINVCYTDIHGIAGWFIPDKERGVIVYCTTGKRSSQAKTSLEHLGYKKIYYLGGVEI